MNLVGQVEGKTAIIIDDMIDTAGTLCEAAKSLKSKGAEKVYAFATHGTNFILYGINLIIYFFI